jgi:hypothetical protein
VPGMPADGLSYRLIARCVGSFLLATREDNLPWLFVSERPVQFTRQAVNYIVRPAGEKAKLGGCGLICSGIPAATTSLTKASTYARHRHAKHTAHYARVAGHRFEGFGARCLRVAVRRNVGDAGPFRGIERQP